MRFDRKPRFATVTSASLVIGFTDYALASTARPSESPGRFLWSEAATMLIGGGLAGACIGGIMAYALVKVPAGVFDPPPEGLTVPWVLSSPAVRVRNRPHHCSGSGASSRPAK